MLSTENKHMSKK